MFYPHYTPHTALIANRTAYPLVEKLQPQPAPAVKIIEAPDGDAFECDVTLAYKRNYLETNELYTVHGNNRVVELRPAMGELRRNPTRFVAIVLMNNSYKSFKTVEILARQLLKVVV